MFSVLSRRILSRAAGAARMNQARNMTHITTEMPKVNGNIYMVAGLGFFVVCAALVQGNGLITWGSSPDMAAALKK